MASIKNDCILTMHRLFPLYFSPFYAIWFFFVSSSTLVLLALSFSTSTYFSFQDPCSVAGPCSLFGQTNMARKGANLVESQIDVWTVNVIRGDEISYLHQEIWLQYEKNPQELPASMHFIIQILDCTSSFDILFHFFSSFFDSFFYFEISMST